MTVSAGCHGRRGFSLPVLSHTLLVVDPGGANVSILSTDSFIEEVQSLLNRLALRVTDRQTDRHVDVSAFIRVALELELGMTLLESCCSFSADPLLYGELFPNRSPTRASTRAIHRPDLCQEDLVGCCVSRGPAALSMTREKTWCRGEDGD